MAQNILAGQMIRYLGRWRGWLGMMLVALYLGAIVLANVLVVRFGPAFSILNAAALVAFDLTARDALHERWRGLWLWHRMAALIAAGALLSWLVNADAGRVALASCAAFVAAGAVDALAYRLLDARSRLVRMNASNVASAAVDSLLFSALAFGLPLLWPIVIGQWLAKLLGGFAWSLLLLRKKNGYGLYHSG